MKKYASIVVTEDAMKNCKVSIPLVVKIYLSFSNDACCDHFQFL